MNDRYDLVVVGGGISGLNLAREVVRAEPTWNVLVLEEGDRPGGTMRSERVKGCLCEWGPNGFLTNVSDTLDLAGDLGLKDALLPADECASNRYLWVRGALRALPMSPPAFLKSDLLSLPGRMRVLMEPFARKGGAHDDETIHDFASRRIGEEAASVLVDAMVSGVYAGDPKALSLRATFSRMAEMEDEHGSLIKAMVALRRARGRANGKGGPVGPGGVLTSFENGMEVLIKRLAEELGSRVRCRSRVTSLTSASGEFELVMERGNQETRLKTPRVALATPAHVTRNIVARSFPRLTTPLEGIPYAGVSVACLIYERSQIPHSLNGFGFLVPRGQGPRMLGCIWVGSIFPAHVPSNRVLLRVMIGGARDPEGAMMSEGRTVDIAHTELSRILGGIDGLPMESCVFRHPRGIPQYVQGHPSRLQAIDAELDSTPGLFLAGNAYRGIGVNDCVRETRELSRRITHFREPEPSEVRS